MNPDKYIQTLESKITEQELTIAKFGKHINQYQKIIQFERRVSNDSISLSLNVHMVNRIFASAVYMFSGWEVSHGNPFEEQYATEKQIHEHFSYSDIGTIYNQLKESKKFHIELITQPNIILTYYLMLVTDTFEMEYKDK